MQLTVIQRCTINPNPATLTFTGPQDGPNPPNQTSTLTTGTNCDGTVTTSVSGASWLHASAGGHIVNPGQLPITISVDNQGLSTSNTPNTGSVIITFQDIYGLTATQQINVSFTITPPCVSPTPTTPTFTADQGGNDPLAQTATVNNSCATTVSWSATVDQSWLSPFSGTLSANSNSTISVQPSIANLPPGTYTGHITFGSATNAPSITVTFNVANPCQAVNTQFSFTGEQGGNDPTSQALTFFNYCALPATWSATMDQSWLSLNPVTSGSLNPNQTTSLNVQPLITTLTAGTYTGHITFTFKETNGNTIFPVVTVTLTINGPCLDINPPSTTFTTTTQFTLTDCGATAGTLAVSFSTTDGGSWLSATTSPTSINPNGTSVLTITVNNQILSPGTYTGQVYVVMTDIYGITTSIQVNVTYTQS